MSIPVGKVADARFQRRFRCPVPDSTPVLIGVGEASERIDAADYAALSPVELASAAARAACDDALSVAALAPHIDLIAAIRQFEVSTPVAKAPFGASDNFPRSVARRLGADPARAVLEITGGQGPQSLVNEFAHAIAAGEVTMALLVGSEAISTVRHLASNTETRDWSEAVGGQLEDRGYGLDGLLTPDLTKHGARSPVHLYALYENARRAKLGLSRRQYQLAMGELFAPFTEVASHNPHAMSQEVFSAAELAEVTPKNRLICDPLPRRMVARDQANQGAALLLTSVGKARELGVPEDRWVYLHGGADVEGTHPGRAPGPVGLSRRHPGGETGAGRGRQVGGRHRPVRFLQLLPHRGVRHPRRTGHRGG